MSIYTGTFIRYEKLAASKLNSMVTDINAHVHDDRYYTESEVDTKTDFILYDQNVMIQVKSDTEIDVDALQINVEEQGKSSLDVTIDTSTTGANALDAGSLGASAWYYIWAIYNVTTSTAAALLSTSSTSPTMPSGYTLKRLIGYAKTDGSSDLLKSYQFMNRFRYDIPIEGTATNETTWTALDCSSQIPPGVREGVFGIRADGGGGQAKLYIRPTGSTWAEGTADGINTNNINGSTSQQRTCMTDSSQSIDYKGWAGQSMTINVEGFICGLF